MIKFFLKRGFSKTVNRVYLKLTETVNGGDFINKKFYNLPLEKQQRIINAGYRVFGHNSYKKSPVSEIAQIADISKSLLFHYFHNKKELYLFLWNEVEKLTSESLQKRLCYESEDFFEMMEKGLEAKLDIMRIYPDIAAFSMRAFYEKDPEVSGEIQKSYSHLAALSIDSIRTKIDISIFRPRLDFDMIVRQMYLAAEGYLWETTQKEDMNYDIIERDFRKLIDFWKIAFCKDI